MSEYLLADAQPAMSMPMHRDRRHGQGVEDADVEVGEPGVGAERHGDVDEQHRADDQVGRQLEERAGRPARGTMSSFWSELADLGEQLQRAVRAGLHGAEPALHEAHHLEQEDVDERARGQQHGDEDADGPQDRLLPVRELDGDGDAHRSMSPRMK